MLQITIPAVEQWDEINQEFITTKEQTLQLEHSLVSLSKWESKWCKPFLSKDIKTYEETADYIRCMTITQNVDPDVYKFITNENMKQVNDYIDAPMTATWFNEDKTKRGNSEQITSELIYYWMISLNVPFECQKWHLNRLLTLIRVCNVKNQPPKKMSRREVMSRNRDLNAARRKQLNTRG
jgi:hypothetical protein